MTQFTAARRRLTSAQLWAIAAIGSPLLASCTGPRSHVWGPPTTVPEPEFVASAAQRAALDARRPLPPPPEVPLEHPPKRSSGGFAEWLRSGRGVTWGAARSGPMRDEGLDRMMADTLTSGSPEHIQEPSSRAPTADVDSWTFPADEPTTDLRRSVAPTRPPISNREPPLNEDDSFGEPFSEDPPPAALPRRSKRTISLPPRSNNWRSVEN